jgi:hypothetical protein
MVEQNYEVAVKAGPTTAVDQGIALAPPATDATATTGTAGATQMEAETGSVYREFDPTPGTLGLNVNSPTISVPEAFVTNEPVPSGGSALSYDTSESRGSDPLPAVEMALATIGTLLAIGALVARRRRV